MSSNWNNFWSKPLNSLTEIFVTKYSVLIAKTWRGSNSVWKIGITSLIWITLSKVATKNRQNRQLAEFRQTSKPKLVGNQILIGKMVLQALFHWLSQNWGPLGRIANLPPLTSCHPAWFWANLFRFFVCWLVDGSYLSLPNEFWREIIIILLSTTKFVLL